MSADSGGKPPSGSSPGRPAADTPQRMIVRGENDSIHGAADTAVAFASEHGMDATMDPRPTPTESDPPREKSGSTSTSEILNSTLSGRYLVTKKIGQGGMGAVYEATHTLIGKRVAVKVLLEKYAEREAIVARLKKEAQLASSIGNEHIIDITDIGNTDDGRTFVVMEYLDGESLAECLSREHTLPEQRMLRIASQAASALAAAHAKGIVHRDIKPENLFLLKRKDADFVKVVDFGISKVRAAITKLTQASVVMGSPQFMSPEQAQGRVEEIDLRTDEWALACIAWEMLSGRCPFTGEDVASLLYQVVHEEPPPLAAMVPGLRPEVEEVLRCALAKNRTDRFVTIRAFARALETAIQGSVASYEPTPPPQPVPFSKETVGYGSAQTEIAGSLATTRRSVDPTLTEKRRLSLTTFSHAAGEFAHRLKIPLPPSRRVIVIAGGSLLVILFGVFLIFRSGGPAKDKTTAQPWPTPAAAPMPRVTITPTPSPPEAATDPVDQQGSKAGDATPKPKRIKGPVDQFEDTKAAPTPRPRPKTQRRIITDI